MIFIVSKICVEYTSEPIETEGMYIPELDLIILDGTRCEDVQKKCLLHELAHAKLHRQYKSMYVSSSSNRIKMEHEADTQMIDELIDRALTDSDTDIRDMNWLDIANKFNLDPYIVKDVMFAKK